MKNKGWFTPKDIQSIAGSVGLAVLLMTTGTAVAQDSVPAAQPTAPAGYTLHESIDLGGHAAGIGGSGAMYDTMVNIESGPRVLGERFELHALPGAKNTLVDSLSAFSNGWGGDPDNYARMDFYKGNLYQFSGTFRRDRQYFDYDLLGNPNIPYGQTLTIGSSSSPSGTYPWPQVNQSPFLYNTVRRMTDTNLTLFPVSKVSYRAGYSHDTFAGPSLTPSGYQIGGSYDVLLQEMQRNSTDDFYGAIDWKPVAQTRLTFEEQVDHYKEDSYFSMDPSYYRFQEADGAKVALAADYDTLTPGISCNTTTAPALTSAPTAGGLPVINPACAVITSYTRYQPTRIIYPTEIFRFQSSSIRNISMNGDIRYTDANMNLPLYQDIFQGLTVLSKTAPAYRSMVYTASASAHRKVTAVDYAVEWEPTQEIGFSDQFTFSNVQEPGAAIITSATALATPASNTTINATGLTAATPGLPEGDVASGGGVGIPNYDFFGQRYITNDVTASWYGWSRATVSLTYRHRNHVIAEGTQALAGNTHGSPLAPGATSGGTVTINQDGGVLNISVRPNNQWNIDGSAELLYADNVFTPVAPRQEQHYRIHALYRPKTWSTLSAAYNDREIHNNTNNMGAPSAAGPLDHVAHTRALGLGAALNPSAHYGLDLNYGYTDVYTSTNICYLGGATTALPIEASTPAGTACPGAGATRSGGYDFGPAKDFEDAPSQYVQAAIVLSPAKTFRSNIGYNLNYADGSRFYNDPRDVAGSLNSKYESPFASVAWTVHPGFIWSARYNYYGYGEGGPSGAPYCATSGPTATTAATVVPCNSTSLTGLAAQTGLNLPNSGETAARNFHANVVTLGLHYAF